MINPIHLAIEQFGRDGFYIGRTTKTPCTDCIQGPTGQSIEDCETCGGIGYIESTTYLPIRAVISWRKLEERSVMVGGIIVSGDCAVAIKYDDYICINTETDRFFVDNKEMKLSSITPSDNNIIYVLGLVYG